MSKLFVNNDLFLKYSNKVFIKPDSNIIGGVDYYPNNTGAVAALIKDFYDIGFSLSPQVIQAVFSLDAAGMQKLKNDTYVYLKKSLGGHVKHKPMYPNFPQQVMEASEAELFLNSIVHYLGAALGVLLLPDYEKLAREPLDEKTKLTVIELGTEEEYVQIFNNLLKSPVSWSEVDKTTISVVIISMLDRIDLTSIPNKENMVFVIRELLSSGKTGFVDQVMKNMNSATDILRLAAGLSDADISLKDAPDFSSFKRPVRRMLLSSLNKLTANNYDNVLSDMLKYKEYWKRLGERLHPREMSKQYPAANNMFLVLRENLPYTGWQRRVDNLTLGLKTDSSNLPKLLELLKQKPGYFARQLDSILRLCTHDESMTVVNSFKKALPSISSTVLLQLYAHFLSVNHQKHRVFIPKGKVSKAQVIEDSRIKLDQVVVMRITDLIWNNLISRYKQLEPLGNVWIDPQLTNAPIPFTLRSASESSRVLTKGTRINLPAGDTVRFFIYWKGETDIDLSGCFMNTDKKYVGDISFYNLRGEEGCHSGDITNAPNGASEFIDINLKTCKERYIVMFVNSFRSDPFAEMEECFAGFMMREKPKSGEIYDERTVEFKMDIQHDAIACIPFIIDTVDRQVIYTDMVVTGGRHAAGSSGAIEKNLIAMTEINKPNLHTLFTLHAISRGTIVDSKEKADFTVGMSDCDITPYDIHKIVGEFIV